jgi:hypothetical protein
VNDDLSFPDVVPLLRRLEQVELVVIGGQAVNFWASRYLDRAVELRDHLPFTSKDVDFCGTRTSVEETARRLGGEALLPEPFDDATPNAGVVLYQDDAGAERTLDVVFAPLGLAWGDVWDHSLRVQVEDEEGPVTFRVLHPYWAMVSRVCNVQVLPPTPRGLRQLQVSVICLREFLLELLDEGNPALVRAVLKLNKRIFRFAALHRHGRDVFAHVGVEPFDAVITDERLPAAHNERNYPRMAEAIQRLRDRQRAAKAP